MNTATTPTPALTIAAPPPRAASVAVRPTTRDDLAAVRDHFGHLDDEGRRLRFHGATNRVPQTVLDVFRDADQRARITRVAVAGNAVRGEAMLVAAPGAEDAELALSVAAHCRRDGIGRRLLSSLVTAAARAGLAAIHADVLPENAAFIALAGTLGFTKRWHPEDSTVLRMTRVVDPRDGDGRRADAA